MGATPQIPWRSVVRPVLLAVLAALAWLVWGAGTATASGLVPDAGDLLKPASSVLAEPLPAPPVVVSAGETAVATATSLTDPATAAVNTLAAPLVPVVGGTVGTVTGLVPGLPDLPLVQAPLPLPLPGILPLPDQLPPLLPEPLPTPPLPLPLPDLLPVPVPPQVPGLPPLTTPAPGPMPTGAPGFPASDTAAQIAAAAPGLAPASITTPADAADAAGRSNTLRFGFSAAQDLPGFASPPGATASPSGQGEGTDHPFRLALPALANGAGTANSGPAGGSGGPADLGGSWPALPAAGHGPNASGAQTLPAGPSFDPGSSPD
jgi:hypothetical protein